MIGKDTEKQMENVHTAFRLPSSLVVRMDRIAAKLTASNIVDIVVTRSTVARKALDIGLTALEEQDQGGE